MALATKLSVKEIQLILRNSPYCDQRSDLIVPNVSWGLLPYEADLFVAKKSDLCIEFEIKRSLEDFKKDFTKYHTHDADLVAYFYYVVPEKIVDKVKAILLEKFGSPEQCPAVIYFSEDCMLHLATTDDHKPFGNEKRKGYRKITPQEKATLGRLVSIRYWNTQNEFLSIGCSAKDRKIKEQREIIKQQQKRIHELSELNGADGWIKCSERLPDNDRLVLLHNYTHYCSDNYCRVGYYDEKSNEWKDPNGNDIKRYIIAWAEIPVYDYYYMKKK